MAAATDVPVGHELLIERTFDAPIGLVFRIWESREHMIRWWGPREFACTAFELDFRPGGAWRACIESQAHGTTWMGGTIREIVRNTRIVFTFAWDHGGNQPGVDTLVTVTFDERDGKTVQRFHQTPFIHEKDRDAHIGGWNQVFDREQAYLQQLSPEIAR